MRRPRRFLTPPWGRDLRGSWGLGSGRASVLLLDELSASFSSLYLHQGGGQQLKVKVTSSRHRADNSWMILGRYGHGWGRVSSAGECSSSSTWTGLSNAAAKLQGHLHPHIRHSAGAQIWNEALWEIRQGQEQATVGHYTVHRPADMEPQEAKGGGGELRRAWRKATPLTP